MNRVAGSKNLREPDPRPPTFRHERIEELHGDPDAFDVESVLGATDPVTFAVAPQLEPAGDLTYGD